MAPRIPLVVKNTMLNQERATREREKGGNPRKGKSSDSNILKNLKIFQSKV